MVKFNHQSFEFKTTKVELHHYKTTVITTFYHTIVDGWLQEGIRERGRLVGGRECWEKIRKEDEEVGVW